MRKIGVVTVNRSDFGLYRPILKRLAADRSFETFLYVSGAHLSESHGSTVKEIESEGTEIAARISLNLSDDKPADIAAAIGDATAGFARAFERRRPDLLLTLGDRFEMFAAVAAAAPLLIPVAHVHGGEITEGAIDNAFRHAITKLSHLHFTSTEAHAARVRQMGEEPWRVVVSGAPGLDNLSDLKILPPAELVKRFNLIADRAPLLVTFHPVTLEPQEADKQTGELLAALEDVQMPVVFTAPNNDTNGAAVRRRIDGFVSAHANARLVEHFGTQAYFSMMKWAVAMVGNSSSGIIEAPSFGLPVVNIGKRQQGRTRGANVIDCADDRESIAAAIEQATSAAFRASIATEPNPYGDGHASERIVSVLKSAPINDKLLMKLFIDGERDVAEALV